MVIKFSCVTAYFQAIAIFDLSFSPKLTMLYFTAIKRGLKQQFSFSNKQSVLTLPNLKNQIINYDILKTID
jgi:hypothetical protein